MMDRLLALDGGILLWLQEHLRGPVQDAVVLFYTSLGNAGMLFIAAAAVMLFFRRTRRVGVTALVALLLGFLCTNLVLKPLVARPRPWLEVEGLVNLVEESPYSSFPSGHATAAFAFAFALWFGAKDRWMKRAALAAAVLMGFSRLYVGVHYPSDVLAGVLVGLLAGWTAWRICKERKQSRPGSI